MRGIMCVCNYVSVCVGILKNEKLMSCRNVEDVCMFVCQSLEVPMELELPTGPEKDEVN